MTRVAVVVPYRWTDGRAPLLHWVMGKLNQARREWSAWDNAHIVLCTDDPHGEGPWRKARAVAHGIAQTDADVIVVHDADCWSDGTGMAVEAVLGGWAQWATPHAARPNPSKPRRRGQPGLVYRLKPGPTAVVLGGGPVTLEELERPAYYGQEGGGIVVLTRDAWNTAPLDPRFEGWGQEDAAWSLALRTLVGAPWRGDSALVHLWHEPQPRWTSEYGSREGKRLWERYQQAARSRDEMAALIAEHDARAPQ